MMPIPTTVPLNVDRVNSVVSTVVTGATCYVSAPFAGTILEVGATNSLATATAPATCTTNINGAANPITGGAFTIASGATAGTNTSANPTGANVVAKNDTIGFVFSGTGTAGGQVNCYADIRRGS
jgi:hypothetical protein